MSILPRLMGRNEAGNISTHSGQSNLCGGGYIKHRVFCLEGFSLIESKTKLTEADALIIVDVQNDFLPGGALAVAQGDEIIQPLNKYIEQFVIRNLCIVATRDWHPENHISFHSQGGVWPAHCIANTSGAEFSALLQLPDSSLTISKASQKHIDAYSGFENTDLKTLLRRRQVSRVFVGGLATDYCVMNTVLDALKLGFQVCLLLDAIRAVNIKPEDGQQAIHKMTKQGAMVIKLEDLEI